MLNGNWVKFDPNYQLAKAYVETVPKDQHYNADVAGGRTIGQAWGRMLYEPDLKNPEFLRFRLSNGFVSPHEFTLSPPLQLARAAARRPSTFTRPTFWSPAC